MQKIENLAEAFVRFWYCGVTQSGYHNGAGCTPDSDWPHDSKWGCGYKWRATFTDEQWKKMINSD